MAVRPWTEEDIYALALNHRRLNRRATQTWAAWVNGYDDGCDYQRYAQLSDAHHTARRAEIEARKKLEAALDEQIAWEDARDPIAPETHDSTGG